jgi:hypothetical protein
MAALFDMKPTEYAKAVLYRDLGVFNEPLDQRKRSWRKKKQQLEDEGELEAFRGDTNNHLKGLKPEDFKHGKKHRMTDMETDAETDAEADVDSEFDFEEDAEEEFSPGRDTTRREGPIKRGSRIR